MAKFTIKTNSSLFLSVCFVFTTGVLFAQQDYSNTHITNPSGQPMGLIDLQSHNRKLAKLYITGNEATFGPNQVLIKGSGYVEALTNESVHLIAPFRYKDAAEAKINKDELDIKVTRIDWDDDGHTTHISGMASVAATDFHGRKLKIKSDFKNPTLTTNGVLVLDVEKLGKFFIDFRFGGMDRRGTFVGDPVIEFANTVDERSSAMSDAAEKGDLEKVKALLAKNPDLAFCRDKYGETPLLLAAREGKRNVVELLLACKADADAKADDDSTPLFWAAGGGYKDLVELLLARGANVNVKRENGWTPLHMAAYSDYMDVAELLLKNNAEVNAKDENGYSPLHWALSKSHNDMAELLRKHGGQE